MSAGGVIISNSEIDLLGLAASIGTASIVIGGIVSIISFLGCFGAANEKGLLLKTYFVLLIILVILEISVGAAAYAKGDQIPGQLQQSWHNAAASPNSTTLLGIQEQVKKRVMSSLNAADLTVLPIILCLQIALSLQKITLDAKML